MHTASLPAWRRWGARLALAGAAAVVLAWGARALAPEGTPVHARIAVECPGAGEGLSDDEQAFREALEWRLGVLGLRNPRVRQRPGDIEVSGRLREPGALGDPRVLSELLARPGEFELLAGGRRIAGSRNLRAAGVQGDGLLVRLSSRAAERLAAAGDAPLEARIDGEARAVERGPRTDLLKLAAGPLGPEADLAVLGLGAPLPCSARPAG